MLEVCPLISLEFFIIPSLRMLSGGFFDVFKDATFWTSKRYKRLVGSKNHSNDLDVILLRRTLIVLYIKKVALISLHLSYSCKYNHVEKYIIHK